MQIVFLVLLILVLVAAVLAFAIMGALQSRRRAALARTTHEMGLRFAAEDPFDVPGRYGRFALIGAGHSPRAHNVSYGRVGGVRLRAFDFRYEVGHGTRRLTRRYRIVVFEIDRPMPPVLMWHERDLEAAPMPARADTHPLGPWRCRGDRAFAATLARACEAFADDAPSLQADDGMLLLALPEPRRRRARAWSLDRAEAVVRDVTAAAPTGPQPPAERAETN